MRKITLFISVFTLSLLSFSPAHAEVLEVNTRRAESISLSKPPYHYKVKNRGRVDYWIMDYYRGSHQSGWQTSNIRSSNEPRSNGRMSKRWKWSGGHWSGVGIYYNGLVQDIGNLHLPSGAEYMSQSAKSIGVNVNFIDLVLVSNNQFGLITGLGLEMNNFRFDRNVGLIENQDGVVGPDYSYDVQGLNLTKSKLTTVYMNIPLLVEFQFGRSRNNCRGRGFINFGAIAGIRLNGHTKVQYRDLDGKKQTTKKDKGLNLRNFHYGAEFNVGWRGFALSARYYPHSIFEQNSGPKVQQANIGMSFMF